MINNKKLLAIFGKAKNNDGYYYNFNNFKNDAKNFIKDFKNNKVILSMVVSRSGMSRKFNSASYNTLLNICYNNRIDPGKIKVNGCGMDMHWYLLFTTIKELEGKTKSELRGYNRQASDQPLI